MNSTPPLSTNGKPVHAALKDYIIDATGLSYYRSRDDMLANHVADRMAALGLADHCTYLRLLMEDRRGAEELDRLVELLTIGETHFFRHAELFHALRDCALPDVLRQNRASRQLRVWSAGCSIGAEAYSVSILLRTELAEQVSNWQLSILGTDINRKSIERARAARYDDWALRGVSDPLKARYFHRHEKQWELAAEFREDVRFEYHNLTRRWQVLPVVELPKFDVILCRNVLIYFSQEVAQDVVRYLYGRLNDGGWLLVGHAEYGQEALRVLEAVTSHGAVLYRKPAMNCAVTGAGGQQVVGASDATVVAIRSNTHSSRSAQLQPPGKPSALPTRQSVFARAAAATSSKIDAVAPVPTSLSEELHKLRTLADAGRFDLALQSCDELLGRHRMAPACHLHQGLLLVAMDELERAEQALQRAVYLDGAYAPAQYYLGLVRLKQGDSAAAARRFRHTLQLLATRKTASPFVELDGLTADELTELANMHLESTTP